MRIPGTEHGRPTAASLSAGFGFRAPADFVALVQAIWDVAGSDEADSLYNQMLGVRPEGASARYSDLTPWELFPFGSTGGDGEHYGYLVHAFELGRPDELVASFLPGPGVLSYLGRTTREAVENLVAFYHQDELPSDVRAVLERLDWSWDPSRADRVNWFDGDRYVPILPDVPPGYRYEPTSNGVGVLAPAERFGTSRPVLPAHRSPVWDYVHLARPLFDAGLYGDALVVLDECRTHAAVSAGPDGTDELLGLLAATWSALGRPIPWPD